MAAVAFDTYKMVKRLRESGFTDVQAEAVTAAVQEAGSVDLSHLATKEDAATVKTEVVAVKVDVAAVRTEVAAVKTDVAAVKTEVAAVKTDVAEVKTVAAETKADLLRWMFGAMAAQTALIVGLLKLLGH